MTYNEAVELVDYLNERFRKSGMKPWYLWAVDISWEKLMRWRKLLAGKNRPEVRGQAQVSK